MKLKKFKFLITFILIGLSLFLISIGIAQINKVILGNVAVPSYYTLSIIFSGTGTGQVTATPGGILTSSGYFEYPINTSITISGLGTGGSIFLGWSGAGCSGTSDCNITMDSNKTVYANFWGPPLGSYLIGWYRFDEGSGSTVYNRATNGSLGGGLLPNLNVVQNDNVFWTFLSGFGSTRDIVFGAGDGLVDFAWAKPNRTIGGANKSCFGMFVRPKSSNYPSGSGGMVMRTQDSYLESGVVGYHISNENEGGSSSLDFATNVIDWSPGTSELRGRWHFHFVNNNGQWWIVKPEGDRVLGMSGISMVQTINFQWIFVGVRHSDSTTPTKGYYPGGVSYGDWLIYNQTALTDSQWAEIYDNLRSRYGMAVRSGW